MYNYLYQELIIREVMSVMHVERLKKLIAGMKDVSTSWVGSVH